MKDEPYVVFEYKYIDESACEYVVIPNKCTETEMWSWVNRAIYDDDLFITVHELGEYLFDNRPTDKSIGD